jgi:hypothetical protein
MNDFQLLLTLTVIVLGSSLVLSSEAVLWDLIIYANIENTPIQQGQNPIIKGIVEDHASRPVSDIQVEIRVSGQTITLVTNQSGTFEHEFDNLELLPGKYIVNIKAKSSEGDIGLGTVEFEVKGKSSLTAHTAKMLDTAEAIKYLNSDPDDFENDPIGLSLYNYYQDLYTKFLEQEIIQQSIDKEKLEIENRRSISENVTQQAINDKNPGSGIYSGYKRDAFVDNLDLDVRHIIEDQLDYTLNIFKEAQDAMNEVLANGGTMEEARAVYFEKAKISKEVMNSLTVENTKTYPNLNTTNVTSDVIFDANANTTSSNSTNVIFGNNINTTSSNSTNVIFDANANTTSSNSTYDIPGSQDGTLISFNGTDIKVGSSTTVVYVNINGTMHQFFVNGTKVTSPTTNSVE